VLRAFGAALAAIFHGGIPLTEFDMRNLVGITCDTNCDWQP